MRDVLIVNACPLILLGNADRVELLHTLGANRIIVPEPVFDEGISGGHTDTAARAISDATWRETRASPPIPASIVAWEIGRGESSVIATALHEPDAGVIIDDLNGRKCALAHGLDVVGTLGVVIAAHRRGRTEDPHEVLLELRAAGHDRVRPSGRRAWRIGTRSVCAAMCMRRSTSKPKSAPAAASRRWGWGGPNALGTLTAREGRTFPSAESKWRSKCSARR